MVHTAAHLVEHVFPQVPVRQWVISFPKRLRYFLHRDPALTGRVLRVWLRVLEARLRACCPNAPPEARFGAVSFIQRFGSTLNAHTHIHACVIDGVFSLDPDSTLRFHRASALTDNDIAAVEHTTRERVLRLFERELRACGYRVASVRNPLEALAMAVKTRPDMVLASAEKTAHLIVVHEDNHTCGIGAEVFIAPEGIDTLYQSIDDPAELFERMGVDPKEAADSRRTGQVVRVNGGMYV